MSEVTSFECPLCHEKTDTLRRYETGTRDCNVDNNGVVSNFEPLLIPLDCNDSSDYGYECPNCLEDVTEYVKEN